MAPRSYWLETLVDAMRVGASVVPKRSSRLMHVISWLLRPINPHFMEFYTTTIGHTIYMPEELIGTVEGADTVHHEIVHVQQYKQWGIWFMLGYVLALPAVFTLRAHWEFEAYRESMFRYFDRFGHLPDYYLEQIADEFTSGAYFWMCPFPGYVMKRLSRYRQEVYDAAATD